MFVALFSLSIGEIIFLTMSATALKCKKWRFSSLNDQNFGFFGLVSKVPGLVCVKIPCSNISCLGPFNLPLRVAQHMVD
jgi:hypothetical protein